ncbi:MAG: hypothetical protein ABI599_07915 [Flavobacteriales bacterium]
MDIGKLINLITLAAAALAACLSGFMNLKYGPKLQELEAAQNRTNLLISEQSLDQGAKKFDRDFKFSIIDHVFTAIGSGKPEQISVALAMVKTMLSDDPDTQKELLKAIANTTDATAADQVQAAATVQKIVRFDSAQVTTAIAVLDPLKPTDVGTGDAIRRFDIFFGEGKLKLTELKAKQVLELLQRVEPEAQVRVRPLPDVVNARAGYGIKQNEIRYDAGEVREAERLQMELEKGGVRFRLHESFSKTGAYMSLFIVE